MEHWNKPGSVVVPTDGSPVGGNLFKMGWIKSYEMNKLNPVDTLVPKLFVKKNRPSKILLDI